MAGSTSNRGHVIDTGKLPPNFPTHRQTSQFWEALGRTIATFGFLEEILGKAIFALTATQPCDPASVAAAYAKWVKRLERALTDQLVNLADSYPGSVALRVDFWMGGRGGAAASGGLGRARAMQFAQASHFAGP